MSEVLELDTSALRPSTLTPPQSKSDAQRALVLARILGSDVLRDAVDTSEAAAGDVRVLQRGLRALDGASPRVIDCADGGAPFRFLLAQAALAAGETRLTGAARLGERPRRALLDALRAALGPCGLVLEEGASGAQPWSVHVRGFGDARAADPRFRVDSSQSGQFASSLLLAAAALAAREARPWSVEQLGATASAGYVAMTVAWLRRAGFGVSADGGTLAVAPAPAARVSSFEVPGDWSSLAYLLLVAWKSGGAVTRVDAAAEHPDRALLRLLPGVGLRVDVTGTSARVRGVPSGGVTVSARECPDALPALAALACVLPSPSRFSDVGILRQKESDRLEGVAALVSAAGGVTQLEGDSLRIEPPKRPATSLVLDSGGDHRRAMAAATLACLAGAKLRLTSPDCVSKSFPRFWDELTAAGARLERRAQGT